MGATNSPDSPRREREAADLAQDNLQLAPPLDALDHAGMLEHLRHRQPPCTRQRV